MNINNKKLSRIFSRVASLSLVVYFLVAPSMILAQSSSASMTSTGSGASPSPINISDSSFRVVVCDGPTIPSNLTSQLIPSDAAAFKAKFGHTPPYVPCNFNGVMLTVQRIIDLLMVAGVIGAICIFIYIGFLYMKGDPSDRNKARDMFKKVFVGFLIMLCAWFVVYQILSWLTGNTGFATLIGK